jgi:hypothetical protein
MKEVRSKQRFMEEFGQMIRDAEILLRGTDPEQREQGEEKLRAVVRLAEGSVYAKQANELLAAGDRRLPEPVEPELRELMILWSSIQGFEDYRLATFLRRLELYSGTAVPLQTTVIRELRKWILNELPQLGKGVSSTKIAALNEFVAAVRGVAAYEELPEFEQLRDALFQMRLQETVTQVDRALEMWDSDKAQRLLDELVPLPDTFKARVEQLQEDVYGVDRQRRTVENLLQQLANDAPETWFEARLQLELLQQLEQFLPPHNIVPTHWLSQLEEGCTRLAGFVEQFIRAQAFAAVTIQQLRDFWTEFKHISAVSAEDHWQMDEDWFRPGLDLLCDKVSRQVKRARNPEELTAIANDLQVDLDGLPQAVAVRAGKISDQVTRSAAAWKAMHGGRVFELPSAASQILPVPSAWRRESTRYTAWLQQIETTLNQFRNEIVSVRDYQEGLQLANGILAKAPNHALANKLKAESTRRIACNQLDQAILSWNLETFLELFKDNNPGELYAALITEKETLFKLRALTNQKPLTDWQTAAQWWAQWHAANKNLPVAKPDALSEALDQQAAKRYQEWYAALDRLLKVDLTPEEYETAAESLKGEANSNLRTYQKELQRKATIGRIEQHISDGLLEEAEQELNSKLPPESTEAGRLRVRLKIVQVRQRGSVETAEYLLSEWEKVKTFLEQPQRVLLETIQALWNEDQQDWVNKLSQLVARVLTREAPEDGSTQQLAEWQAWIQIEEQLVHNFSSSAIKQLADYLRTATPGALLDQRLRKILRHWQAQNNTVMLAWAFQAFQPKSTAAEQFDQATDDLSKETDRVADDVQSVLAQSEDLKLEDLTSLQASLQEIEERWRSLKDFLSLLSHRVQYTQPSSKFVRAMASVSELSRISTSLGQLENTDLRQQAATRDFEDVYSRARRLKNVASQKRLLKTFERLQPLKEELFFWEQRIRETAEHCRSKDALHVLEPDLFNKLANYVKKVIEIFEKAEAKGGTMWSLVSVEYESLIYHEACVFLPPSGLPQLDQLVHSLEGLHSEELNFMEALRLLEDPDRQPIVPWGGAFDPKSHLDYLRLIPPHAPGSLKIYHRFDRARRNTLKIVLEAPESPPYLPVWVRDYLEKGVPKCLSAS